jgi:formylglycine-generating enzyme required for sulfatase activity
MQVHLSRPVAILDREITWADFFYWLPGLTGAMLPAVENHEGRRPDWDEPVVVATWYDTARYCRWLSRCVGREEREQALADPTKLDAEMHPPDQDRQAGGAPRYWPLAGYDRPGFRLPTEAEWEIACGGGTTTTWSWGQDERWLPYYAWYELSSNKRTHPVRSLRPNLHGFHDMHGNVAEWCHDLYQPFEERDTHDPVGAKQSANRVHRGSSWLGTHWHGTRSERLTAPPGTRNYDLGFRIAFTLPDSQDTKSEAPSPSD